MAKRVQLPDGTIGEFPDEMRDSDIESVLQKQFGSQQTGIPQSVLDNLRARSAQPTQFEKDRQGANTPGQHGATVNFLKGLSQIPAALANAVGNGIANLDPATAAANAAKTGVNLAANEQNRKADNRSVAYRAVAAVGDATGIGNASQLEQMADTGNTRGIIGNSAGQVTGAATMPVAARAFYKYAPSTGIAKTKFQQVAQTVGNDPVNTNASAQIAMDIQDAGARYGDRVPKVVTKFMNRITDPTQPDLTYSEARKFQSRFSRLSTNEVANMNPETQRMMGMLADEVKQSTQAAANAGGVGDTLSDAMRQYRQGKQFNAAASGVLQDTAKSFLKIGLPAGVSYYLASRLINNSR